MRYLLLIAAITVVMGTVAMAHPHHDCPPEDQNCGKHSHPDAPKGGPK